MRPYLEKFIETDISKQVFDDIRSWYIFVGCPGTGKTRLAMEMLKKLRGENLKCKGITFKRMMFDYRHILLYQTQSELEFVDDYCSFDVLCIDEIDKTTRTDSEKTVLYEILKTRYECDKQTILITNEQLNVLRKELFGEALWDRLQEVCKIIYFSGESFRKKKKGGDK